MFLKDLHTTRAYPVGILVFLMISTSAFLKAQSKINPWEVFSLGTPALTIKLPGPPGPMGVTIPPSVINSIRAYSAYRFLDQHAGLDVKLFFVSYADDKLADTDSHADQLLLDLEKQGAVNIRYKASSIKKNTKQGIQWTGTLKINDVKEDFTITLFVDNSSVWKVMTFIKDGDKNKREIVEQILSSISFK